MRWLTTAQAGEAIAVSEATVRRWVDQGRIEAVNVGSVARPRFRISEDALAAFMRKLAA